KADATESESEPEPKEDDGSERSLFRADDEATTVFNPFAKSAGKKTQSPTETSQPQAATNRYGRVLAVPSARILARELDVDIAAVPGSGPNGRVRRDDVRAFKEQGAAAPGPAATGAGPLDLPPPVTYRTPSGYADREQREP